MSTIIKVICIHWGGGVSNTLAAVCTYHSSVIVLLVCYHFHSYDSKDIFGKTYRDISNLIEHPEPVQPPGEPAKSVVIPVILTSKERKKLRKQRRREEEKEKQEKIQFGLIEKPEPKVNDYYK